MAKTTSIYDLEKRLDKLEKNAEAIGDMANVYKQLRELKKFLKQHNTNLVDFANYILERRGQKKVTQAELKEYQSKSNPNPLK